MCMEATNRKRILSGVQQFILSPCVRQVRFSGTTCSLIPQRIKMTPQSFCQLVPCGSFPFVLAHLLPLEENPSAFVSVRCLWADVWPCLALVSYSRIVFQKQRTIRIEQTKDGPEEAKQPSAPHSPAEALKHSFWPLLLFPDTRLLSGLRWLL